MMLVSRESEAGNWKNTTHFSLHFGPVEQAPFFGFPMVAEAAEGRAVPPLWLHSKVKVPLWEGEESCPGVALCRLGVPVCSPVLGTHLLQTLQLLSEGVQAPAHP